MAARVDASGAAVLLVRPGGDQPHQAATHASGDVRRDRRVLWPFFCCCPTAVSLPVTTYA